MGRLIGWWLGKEDGTFPDSKIGPDLLIRLRGHPDLCGWLMLLFLCKNYAKTAAVNKDVSEPQGLDSFPDSQSWALGCDDTVWATPWSRSSSDCCVFFSSLFCSLALALAAEVREGLQNSWIGSQLCAAARCRAAASPRHCCHEGSCENMKLLRAWWDSRGEYVQECLSLGLVLALNQSLFLASRLRDPCTFPWSRFVMWKLQFRWQGTSAEVLCKQLLGAERGVQQLPVCPQQGSGFGAAPKLQFRLTPLIVAVWPNV